MKDAAGGRSGEALAAIVTLLDVLAADDRRLASPAHRLELARAAITASGRLHAVSVTLLAEAEAADAASLTHGGASTATWLADTQRLTRRHATGLVTEGQRLAAFAEVGAATLAGAVAPAQASAITRVLTALPDDLAPSDTRRAEQFMVRKAATFDATGLTRLARHLVEVVAPDVADDLEAARLEREERSARKSRHLTFTSDGMGSVLVRGSLPVPDAELLIAQVDALAHQALRRALDAKDPWAEQLTPAMRRADALVTLCQQAALHGDAPSHGGDRPRVVVTIGYDRLLADARTAGLVESDQEITAGELRRLACDADILPAVLGGPSEPLDVGREQRLVTRPIRAALTVRDRGCVFPGCDRPPAHCEAHHIVPWYLGGNTSLENLVLACVHHHRLIEPARGAPNDGRWEVRLSPRDGLAEVLPPRHVDPGQAPRRHQRFRSPTPAADG